MAFNPRSDIIAEVMSAAEPSRASLAAERLAKLGQTSLATGGFAVDLARLETSATPILEPGLADARDALSSLGASTDKAAKAKVDFEAMLRRFDVLLLNWRGSPLASSATPKAR